MGELKHMAGMYGFDIGRPAQNAKEAFQWLYFEYLAAVKEQNDAVVDMVGCPRSWTSMLSTEERMSG